MADAATSARLQQLVGLLTVAHDGDEAVLGRPDLGVYVAVPEPGAAFVTTLQRGASLAEATMEASWLAGEEVDGEDFLRGLGEAGLLDEPATGGAATGRRIRWIEGVPPRTAARLFGPVGWTCYGVAAVFAIGALVMRPDLRPRFEDVWFLGDPVLSILAFLPISLALGAAHEAWHWLAGRAIGVPAVFRVSRRGISLVFETDLTQIVTVPRRRRYGPFLAGMAFDATVLAVALGLRLLYRADLVALPPVVDRLLGVVILSQVVVLAWQWGAVFMRSDGYAVLANALRCHNLYRATWLTVKERLWRLPPDEAAELAGVSPHDRRVASWFALLYVAGMAGVAWLAVNFGLPFAIAMVLWTANNLAGLAVASVAFWESVAVLAVVLAQWIVPPLLALRERRLRQAGEML